MLKFLSQKVLDWKLRGVPEEQRAVIQAVMQQNPKLFETIAKEIEAKKKSGIDERAAALQVFFAHKQEIAQALQKAGTGPAGR